ncbi:hypothetical protein I4U23_027873 [Adineta vaga]|nr:hypothetical protein I4U23_027873 [Adineta vaga]
MFTTLSNSSRHVWFKVDQYEADRLIAGENISSIVDLKGSIKDQHNVSLMKHKAFFDGEYLSPVDPVPESTTYDRPIHFLVMNGSDRESPVESTNQENTSREGIRLSSIDSSRTRTMHRNVDLASRFNQQINSLSSNYDESITPVTSGSRDSLLSNDTSSSSWTFHNPFFQVPITLWRYLTNKTVSTSKSKSK